eukprot:3063203-Prymnesium_polylepis.1
MGCVALMRSAAPHSPPLLDHPCPPPSQALVLASATVGGADSFHFGQLDLPLLEYPQAHVHVREPPAPSTEAHCPPDLPIHCPTHPPHNRHLLPYLVLPLPSSPLG